jgi:phosphate transport system substrate-binding protein
MTSPVCIQAWRRAAFDLARALAASCLLPVAASAADDREPPADNPLVELATLEYRPAAPVEGSLKLSGSSTLEQAAAFWAEGFMRVHPAATVTLERTSTDAGWRDLAEGKADVALLSRPIAAEELAAVTANGRKPIVIAAAFEPLTWIVHESNPVTALPWSPETGILPGLRPATGDGPPRWGRWLDAADWADVAVTVHGPGKGSGSRWHLEKLLGGQAGWPGPIADADAISAVAEAVAKDRGGLGLVGAAAAARDGIRAVPLELPAKARPPEDAVPGSERTPDERPLFIAVMVPAEGDWPAATREFVGYVLSYPGQLDVAKDGLAPLTRGEIFAQQERLGRPVQR